MLGVWGVSGGMTMATALHLQCGPHRFVLGGPGHRFASDARLEAAPVNRVDAQMRASDFEELLAIVDSARGG